MNRIIKISNLLLLLGFFCSSFAQRNNQEFRATWVITWEMISGSNSVDQNKALARSILDNHQEGNFNAVLWHGRQSGTAYYTSSYEPWGSYAGGQYPGFDPLAYAIEEAHKRGMELHVWFNCFAAGSSADGAPAKEHPEWICRDRDGNPMTSSIALSPGMEACRDYTVNVAMEIVNNYDIDGIHLDYIRWNEYSNSKQSEKFSKLAEENGYLDGMITPEQVKELEENKSGRYLYDVDHPYSAGIPTGFTTWDDWWRWSVTEFVKSLHDSIQAVKPWVRLSVAALGKYNWSDWQGYGSVYQDAALWFNEGYIDQLTPMSYHWTTGDGFKGMLDNGTSSWGPWIRKGITDGRLFSVGPGSYILDEQKIWNRHPEIVDACRDITWVDGFQFFSYGSWNSYQYFDEAGQTFFKRNTKIRASALIDNIPPAVPTIAVTKIDSLNYQLTVTPASVKTDNQWYAIYRSTDNVLDMKTDDIIDIHFGDLNSYSFTDSYSGNQDYNAKYYYAATALDRFWNESEVSSLAESDPLPSFAPTVISSTPSEGDTIPVNSDIVFTFSKTMDVNTLSQGLVVEPSATVALITWSTDLKTATIQFDPGFAFDTAYKITLTSDVKDINSRSIDGNGDGLEGDSFTVNFRTLAVDLTGPVVQFQFPTIDDEYMDVEDVITIVFDEQIDKATVIADQISFLSNGRNVIVDPMLTVHNNRSVLNLRPFSRIPSDSDVQVSFLNTVTDTLENPMASPIDITFHTANSYYTEKKTVDAFTGSGLWQEPEFSGSTAGIIGSLSNFGYIATNYAPGYALDAASKKSAFIEYVWDDSAATHLLREHINASPPTAISIDTTYTIQCYVYGDGSQNLFNFSLYEKTSSGTNTSDIIEVGTWTPIDWIGWKLVEWDLGDATQVGDFISANRNMDGHHYNLDGLLLKKGEIGASKGKIFVDELRLVKKTTGPDPENHVPVLQAMNDTTAVEGKQIKIYPIYIDEDAADAHRITVTSDTTGVKTSVMGHTSGSIVYLRPQTGFVGTATIVVIVRDLGVGELSDTTSFFLSVTPLGTTPENLVPAKWELSQNFPNPFNPTTKIRFNIPKHEMIRIEIYDMLGQQVSEIANREFSAGFYEILFDGSSLPSGQYFYRLVSDEKILTRKMTLIK